MERTARMAFTSPVDGHQELCSVEQALRQGLAIAPLVSGSETLPLVEATGRVLAEDAQAETPLPPFDASAMDGYAVSTADLRGQGPWRLPIAGRVVAGRGGEVRLPRGAAIRIFTGAPVPPGADAVVMQEHVKSDGVSILVSVAPRAGSNIRRLGEDFALGQRVLRAGSVVGAREAAALAAIGKATVSVRRRLRVSILSTGSELAEPGVPLAPGQIWNSNRFALRAALATPWVVLRDLGALPDDPASLTAALRDAARTSDMIVSTGGVSVGEEDHMAAALSTAGGTAEVLRVAMKPGKPLLLGQIGAALYLGLPGNPVAAFVSWTVFGAQFAAAMAGIAETAPRSILAEADFALSRRTGRAEFRPAQITGTGAGGAPTVALLDATFSARLSLLCAADGLAHLPAETETIAPGDLLRFLPL